MAPEQARGEREIGPRVDVFALGCVLFQCITGRPPFVGDQPLALLAKIVLEDAPRVVDLVPDVPPRLDEICAAMMSKLPEQRPHDGRAVAAELMEISQDGSAPARRADSAPVALTPKEQRLLCAVLAGKVLALAPTLREATTLPSAGSTDASDAGAALAAAVLSYGGRLDQLADGSVIVTWSSVGGSAKDQASRGARCALALRGIVEDAPIALVMGRGRLDRSVPVGEVIERGARLLRGAERPEAAPAGVRPILIDEVTAGLLDARFDVALIPSDRATEPDALALLGELEHDASSRTVLGRATPCVGRERELSLLRGMLEQSIEEPLSHVALVTGVTGVGKSRLLQELLRGIDEGSEGIEAATADFVARPGGRSEARATPDGRGTARRSLIFRPPLGDSGRIRSRRDP